jgi:hypothetical protein
LAGSQEEVGLPQFFVPSARSAEEAEQQYVWLQQLDDSVRPSPRVFRVWFRYNARAYVAEVGKEIAGWPQAGGTVFAIFETPQSISIHIQIESGLISPPIRVPQEYVASRQFFEEPAPNAWAKLVAG